MHAKHWIKLMSCPAIGQNMFWRPFKQHVLMDLDRLDCSLIFCLLFNVLCFILFPFSSACGFQQLACNVQSQHPPDVGRRFSRVSNLRGFGTKDLNKTTLCNLLLTSLLELVSFPKPSLGMQCQRRVQGYIKHTKHWNLESSVYICVLCGYAVQYVSIYSV